MTHSRVVLVACALLVGVSTANPPVQAWGNDGHKIVCAIAYKLLSQPDRDEVDRLTELFRAPDGSSYPFFTHGCVFADDARDAARSEHEPTAKLWQAYAKFEIWHYLNLPRTTKAIPSDPCDENCVLHAIEHHQGRLRDHTLKDQQRAEALLLLGHWVGDVHQPLHVSFADDNGGGNIKPISGFYGQVKHLHSVWDSSILAMTHPGTDWWTFSGVLRDRITPQSRQQWTAVPLNDWAQESYDITTQTEARYCTWVNATCRKITPNGRNLKASYQQTFGAVVELRLQKAGARLAALIEQALHP